MNKAQKIITMIQEQKGVIQSPDPDELEKGDLVIQDDTVGVVKKADSRKEEWDIEFVGTQRGRGNFKKSSLSKETFDLDQVLTIDTLMKAKSKEAQDLKKELGVK